MIIKFNQVDEFVEELKKEFPIAIPNPDPDLNQEEKKSLMAAIRRGLGQILRLTCLYRDSTMNSNIKHATVIATIKSASEKDIIRLERYCGEMWGVGGEVDDKVKANRDTAFKSIEDACKELGIEVRAGIFEEQR
jgi:hypothetical protein